MKRFGHGLALGKFYPFHARHQLLIHTASAQCERLTLRVLANSDETLPLDVRVAWIREEHPEVNVVGGMDQAQVDFEDLAARQTPVPWLVCDTEVWPRPSGTRGMWVGALRRRRHWRKHDRRAPMC